MIPRIFLLLFTYSRAAFVYSRIFALREYLVNNPLKFALIYYFVVLNKKENTVLRDLFTVK